VRRPLRGAAFVVVAMVAVTGCTARGGAAAAGSPSARGSDDARTFADIACGLPHDWLLRTWRGWRADRGGELQILPREYSLIDPGLPHVGPWDYAQRIPMLWYGPGVVPASPARDDPVTLADIAPTQAALLRFGRFAAPDGRALLDGPAGRIPRLLVTLVWDAAGTDVLDRWPDAWPTLRSMQAGGVWFDHATVGSSPTQTAQSHATIGTGAYPRTHGVLAHRLRVGGEMTTPWAHGSTTLDVPTFADVYDRANANAPKVGEVATLTIHLGMLGHGAASPGGDRDIAMLHEATDPTPLGQEGTTWNLAPAVAGDYRMPAWANDVPGFAADVSALDRADGQRDGRWGDDDISQLLQGWDTPARIPYQTRVIEELIRREGFGADAMPDLLFVNYKVTDYVAHTWGVGSPEMRDSLQAQDAALAELVRSLNAQVGAGRWAMVLTADHGAAPSPSETGGTVISSARLTAAIEAEFGGAVVDLVQATEIYLNTDELAANGHSVAEVARFVAGLTAREVAVPGQDVAPDQRVFQAAYPSSVLEHLPCLSVAA
jgi:hypothetical protein